MRLYGHRGAAALARENTVGAVLAALDAGADGVEVDVRLCADDVVVCSHDPDLARVYGEALVVRDTAWDALAEIPTGPGDGPARLADVLDAAGQRGQVIVEVKNIAGEPDFDAPREAVAAAVVDLLDQRRAAGLVDDVLVSSFDWHALDRVASAGAVPVALLAPPGVAVSAAVTAAVARGYAGLHPHWVDMGEDPAGAVRLAHDAGLDLVVWTVDDGDIARALADAGADGVITNDPVAMRAALVTGAS
ncbi:MAG: glycerophosphodiester phosphodiesterase [Mycobacteriales bacterium]